MVSQLIRLIECNYFEITMPMITLDSRIVCVGSGVSLLVYSSVVWVPIPVLELVTVLVSSILAVTSQLTQDIL